MYPSMLLVRTIGNPSTITHSNMMCKPNVCLTIIANAVTAMKFIGLSRCANTWHYSHLVWAPSSLIGWGRQVPKATAICLTLLRGGWALRQGFDYSRSAVRKWWMMVIFDVHDIETRNKSADQPTQLSKDSSYGYLVTDILIKIIVIHWEIMTNGYWGKWVQFSRYDARWKFFSLIWLLNIEKNSH